MVWVRRASQIFFLLLFFALFIAAVYPYNPVLPSDLFLKADPLVAVITMLSSHRFIFGFIWLSATLVVISLFLGRVFCGWVCPLGTIIDISDRMFSGVRSVRQTISARHKHWKYGLLIGIITSAVFSVQLLWFVDPISLLTRSITLVLYPIFYYIMDCFFTIAIRLPFVEDTIFSLYDTLRGAVLPVELVFFQRSVIVLFLFAAIILAGIVSRRFWCRYICPLGAFYGVMARFRINKRYVGDSCTECGRCYQQCKMHAIGDDYRSYAPDECIECLNCIAVCPENAFSYHRRLKPTPVGVDLTRRQVISSAVSGLVAVLVTKTAYADKSAAEQLLRPPGSVPESEFVDRCIRCHECIKICSSTGRFLQPVLLSGGWEGIWTPAGQPRSGYCDFECNLCGLVCPTGAITPLTIERKQQLPIGTAQFDKNRCIPWYRNEDCIVCEEHCPTHEKAIKFDSREVVQHNGSIKTVKYPYVQENLCIGCGICVTKCPLVGRAGIYVTRACEERISAETD